MNCFLIGFLVLFSALFGGTCKNKSSCESEIKKPEPCLKVGEGWSFDIGGSYSWMSFSTPPTYTGSTGGVLGKITYQRADAFFGQARSYYNIGPLSSSLNDSNFQESYTEFVAGYCITAVKNWTITPYAGLGFDFLFDDRTGYGSTASVDLSYSIYYAIVGLETHYTWPDWMLGLRLDCLPMFNQYLEVESLSEAAWILSHRVGVEAQIPFAYRYARNFWLEFAPYYRFLPIGSSSELLLPDRNLNQFGLFVTFRFFL